MPAPTLAFLDNPAFLGARKLLLPLGLALAFWALATLTTGRQFWEAIENRLFDSLTVATAPGKSDLPITIVGIDEASFAAIGKRWPWPRDLHAKVLDRLTELGAAVVAFDVVFSEAATPAEDEVFAQSIARARNVVMSSDVATDESSLYKRTIRVEPIPPFRAAGAIPGLATVTIDSDAVVRQMPDSEDVFWRRTVQGLMKAQPKLIPVEPSLPADPMIRHLGPAHTFPYVSFHRVMQGDPTLPAELFKDAIVLIGRDVRASPEIGTVQADIFATPFLGRSKLLTPGVEIHANIIENVLKGEVIKPAENRYRLLFLSLAVLLVLPALIRWHPVWSGAWFAAVLAGTGGTVYYLFAKKFVWLPWVGVATTLLVLYLSMALISYVGERRRGQQIKGAFSKYVSPDVVEQMIAHPERLRLGGERRELTLLFSDLAGFTSISEKLPPDGVAKLINAYLTGMTRVVMSERGTVDKFIGDAVMAFWGAPLDDAEHGLHAVKAAIAMQKAMDELQPFYREMGVSNVGLRIGLNSGPAIVGNMGSEERFDYTALGDTVNLASRLEGINKMYGTRILLSETTADLVRDHLPLRPVDRVRVKGKNEPVRIFTPCEDPRLIQLTATALTAYREQRWPEARAAWNEVRTHAPGDSVAEVFLERIAEFEITPPGGPEWDGSVALEKG